MGAGRMLAVGVRRPRGGLERPIVPGHLAAYLTAGPTAREVGRPDLVAWGLSEDEAFAQALERLRRASRASDWCRHPQVPSVHMYGGAPGPASARMLVVSSLFSPVPLAGIAVVVPAEEQLMAVPLNGLSALAGVEVLAGAARVAHREAARPISDRLFWTDGVRWAPLALHHGDGGTRVVGPARFDAAVARLMALSLVGHPAVA